MRYGFTDNFDPAFNAGWRRWVLVVGLVQYQWVRRRLGGMWERWWVEPCHSYLWHPVVRRSCWPAHGEAVCPCPPMWGPPVAEEAW